MSLKEIFDFKVNKGRIALAWINSFSSIVLKTQKTTLIFDPVRINSEEYIQADAIIITHEHLDHFDKELVTKLQRTTGALILTTPFISERLSKAKALRVGDKLLIGDVEIYAERCDHPANQPLSFIISTEDGLTIYHPSDSEPFAEMTELREKYKPDILLYLGTSLKDGIEIAELVKPQMLISYWSDKELAERFTKELDREVPETKIKLLKRFEIYYYG